jgi:anti-anti-sigma regulatory factor
MTITTLTMADLGSGGCRARLAGLLTPQSTVVVMCEGVARLPVGILAAAQEAAAASNGFLRLEGLSASARLALQVVDPERRLAVDDPARQPQAVGERPFQVTITTDGSVLVRLLKGIGQHAHLSESSSYDWIRGLDANVVEVDLSQIEHLNSLLVAWLLQLNQGSGAGRCKLVRVGRQAVAQLTQLRLNHLLTIA